MNTVSRADAIAASAPRFFTGFPCIQGHVVERLSSSGRCVECIANNRKKYRSENPETIQKNRRQYDATRREIKNKKASEWREKNPGKVAESLRQWREKNRDQIAAYQRDRKEERNLSNRQRNKQRRADDPMFALAQVVRGRLGRVFRTATFHKTGSTAAMLGCTWSALKSHIEKQFLPGMTWGNRGESWHVDHIRPLANATTKEELASLCHFTNLRPLWADANRRKSSKSLYLI